MHAGSLDWKYLVDLAKVSKGARKERYLTKIKDVVENDSHPNQDAMVRIIAIDAFLSNDPAIIDVVLSSSYFPRRVSSEEYTETINKAFACGRATTIEGLLKQPYIRTNIDHGFYRKGINSAFELGDEQTIKALLGCPELCEEMYDGHFNRGLLSALKNHSNEIVLILLNNNDVADAIKHIATVFRETISELILNAEPEFLLELQQVNFLHDLAEKGLLTEDATERFYQAVEVNKPEPQTAAPKNVGLIEKVVELAKLVAWNFGR